MKSSPKSGLSSAKNDAGEVVLFGGLDVKAGAGCDSDWFVSAVSFVDEV